MIQRPWTCIWASVLSVAVGCAEAPLRGEETPSRVEIALADEGCDTETSTRCLCVGTVGDAAPRLEEVGVDLDVLRKDGWPCVRGDFDQDGAPDYAFPGEGYSCNQSVPVRVLFTRGGHVREVLALPREVSCLQRYVPMGSSQGLVDRGEGNATWFYQFDGKGWLVTSQRSEEN
ncbi:hypothetical protein [Myxococcus sp. CA033]|uniref:hypothetical protein n=1 Tax=unclassified Myxococcus TaxID=2648731 RepID=UPI00157ACD65|nr:hypothetical protein [Myxococcus sp. CA033]NTX52904.1 hypothetical protein [Myxococcus sp. CA039A]